jgi:hypothetical protein
MHEQLISTLRQRESHFKLLTLHTEIVICVLIFHYQHWLLSPLAVITSLLSGIKNPVIVTFVK